MLDEDPEGAQATVKFATRLANNLSRWQDYPYRGSDAGFNKLAGLVRRRTATTALNTHDIMMLTNACLEARRIRPFEDLADTTPEVLCFNTACELIEDGWREDNRA
jgi:hypothetical protein